MIDAPPATAIHLHPRRSVRFSDMSRMIIYTSDHAEAAPWYTLADKARFENEVSADVQRIRMALLTPRPEDVFPDAALAYRCVGIDHLLTRKKTKRLTKRRKRHIKISSSRPSVGAPPKS